MKREEGVDKRKVSIKEKKNLRFHLSIVFPRTKSICTFAIPHRDGHTKFTSWSKVTKNTSYTYRQDLADWRE